tara:strand:+ start:5807 stop:6208 length:402 start_codon:yes stop_codon:yes gene_type:complete
MTDKQTLLSLAERCEVSDRELDAKIARAVGRIPERAKYEGTIKMGDLAWSNGLGYEVPAYTASLDAAMKLVPEDAFWRLGHDGEGGDPSLFLATVFVPRMERPNRPSDAVAITPTLALVAASLRARATQEPPR